MAFKLTPRKLIGINNSILVTLPKDWLNHHGLQKGDRIQLTLEDGSSLVLTPFDENAN